MIILNQFLNQLQAWMMKVYLNGLLARLHYRAERFWNGSYGSVNAHGTVLNRTVPRRTVPPRVGGLDRSRTVRYGSINGIAPFGTVPSDLRGCFVP